MGKRKTDLILYETDILSVEDIGYTHSVLAQCFLPLREKEGLKEFRAAPNGKASLIIKAGELYNAPLDEWQMQEVPSGPKPRLLMLYMNGYAIRHKTPVIDMGGSLNDYLHSVGIPAGGKNRKAVNSQMHNLVAADIRLGLWTADGTSRTIKTSIVDEYEIWSSADPRQRTLWPSEAVLSPRYYDVLQNHRLPYDLRAIRQLQHSSLKMDLYLWLLYRMPRLKRTTNIPWDALKAVFGPHYSETRYFKRDMLKALKDVLQFYPEAANKLISHRDYLALAPTPSPIPSNLLPRRTG